MFLQIPPRDVGMRQVTACSRLLCSRPLCAVSREGSYQPPFVLSLAHLFSYHTLPLSPAEELVSVQLEHALLVLTFDPSELSLAWTLNQLELVNYIAAREFPILYGAVACIPPIVVLLFLPLTC